LSARMGAEIIFGFVYQPLVGLGITIIMRVQVQPSHKLNGGKLI
jgi:hypothetical protein